MPVRLVSTTFFQVSSGRSSSGTAGAPIPALLNSTSRRPKACLVLANSALTDSGSPTSVGHRQALAADRLALGGDLVELVGAAAGERDGVALLHQREPNGLPTPVPPPVTIATFCSSAISGSPRSAPLSSLRGAAGNVVVGKIERANNGKGRTGAATRRHRVRPGSADAARAARGLGPITVGPIPVSGAADPPDHSVPARAAYTTRSAARWPSASSRSSVPRWWSRTSAVPAARWAPPRSPAPSPTAIPCCSAVAARSF